MSITLTIALTFAVASAAPMLPLLLIVVPLNDLPKLLMQTMI